MRPPASKASLYRVSCYRFGALFDDRFDDRFGDRFGDVLVIVLAINSVI
jgi:hypothetical protein